MMHCTYFENVNGCGNHTLRCNDLSQCNEMYMSAVLMALISKGISAKYSTNLRFATSVRIYSAEFTCDGTISINSMHDRDVTQWHKSILPVISYVINAWIKSSYRTEREKFRILEVESHIAKSESLVSAVNIVDMYAASCRYELQ